MKKSYFIMPISIIVHIITINLTLLLLTPKTYLDGFNILYYNLSWLIITYSMNFYRTERRERFMTNIVKLIQLFAIYGLAYFTLNALRNPIPYPLWYQYCVFVLICVLMFIYRWVFYWARAKYRSRGGNYVRAVVIGRDNNLKKLRNVFDEPSLGYRYKGYFDNTYNNSPTYLGKVEEAFSYIIENDIDEIYCMVSKLDKEELKNLVAFADNNIKKLKIIPDHKEMIYRAMSIELYDSVPVLNMRELPLEAEYANIVKRAFDVVFSSLVIVLLLSWLIPIVFIFLKIESKGPLFFKQRRHGVNRKVFWCYKFRSMTENKDADKVMATKNDMRITRVGRILRRTSIDELPQFFNVFLGDMSVVGPRPHMVSHTKQFETSVDKYLVRHFIKPGITGLAQVRGYRGEITNEADIVNRVRYDIFYLEKWSIRFDILIIYYTLINSIRGEKKAY